MFDANQLPSDSIPSVSPQAAFSDSQPPFISIITPSFNRASFIKTAIESVLTQNCNSVEHIIIDGCSTDGTQQLLKSYPHLRVISESDHGVYDALNKGIRMAGGEIIGQLNTDDYYEKGILQEVADLFRINPTVDAVVGGARVFTIDSSGNETTISTFGTIKPNELAYRSTIGVPIFNAWFFRKKLFETIGIYSLEYPLLADRDFLIRCCLQKINIVSSNSIFYHYCQHPGSLTINTQRYFQTSIGIEILRLAEKYLQSESTDSAIKRYCTDWHTLTAIELMIDFLRKRDFLSLRKVILSAIKYNPKWPFIVLSQSPMRIKNYLKKKYATNR